MPMTYAVESDLSVEEFVEVLVGSTLAARRPVDDRDRMAGMLREADLIVTARSDGRLVGVSRALTDFHYATYLSDLAVDEACQGRGVGRRLIEETHERAGRHTRLILLSAPAAATFYEHVGLTRHDSCWTVPPRG